MFRYKSLMISLLCFGLVLSASLLYITSATLPVLAQGETVYADGYYDAAGGAQILGGARANLESANPQIRDNGFSIMRVAASHKILGDPNPNTRE